MPKFYRQGPKLSGFFKRHFIYKKTLGESQVSAVVLATEITTDIDYAVKVIQIFL